MRHGPSGPGNREFEKFHEIGRKGRNGEPITNDEFDFFRNMSIQLLESMLSNIVKGSHKEYEIGNSLKRLGFEVEDSFEQLCKEDKMIHVLELIRDLKQKKGIWAFKYGDIRKKTTTGVNKIL